MGCPASIETVYISETAEKNKLKCTFLDGIFPSVFCLVKVGGGTEMLAKEFP